MRACALLPLLKSVVKLPEDATSLERINFYATQRLNDNDKQVTAAARGVADAFKHINVRCMGVEPGSDNYTLQMEFEAIDKQREEEEWNMLSKEEQDEQRKLDEMIQKMKLDNKKYLAATVISPGLGTPETEGGARKPAKTGAAEKPSPIFPIRNPTLAKFKSTVSQITSLHLGSSTQPSASAVQPKLTGSLPVTSSHGITTLSRSPPILRTQGASMSAGLAKAMSFQTSTVTPLAPSSTIRATPSITIPAPSHTKPPLPTVESNEASPMGSASQVASSKVPSKPGLRNAKSS